MSNDLIWCEPDSLEQWDYHLASLGGHPLQSLLWGEARRRIDGITHRCLAGCRDGAITALARVETRRVPVLGPVAWISQGPVGMFEKHDNSLEEYLRECGYLLLACKPWREVSSEPIQQYQRGQGTRTIWLDLRQGKQLLSDNLDKQWRYGVGRAEREGVRVELSSNTDDLLGFYTLCKEISTTKGFQLPGGFALMQALLEMSSPAGPVQAHLFVARLGDSLLGGVFIMRAGLHMHYFWGGVDRGFPHARAGEALQWAVIEWGLAQGCALYDLEGIDPLANPGTYRFKKKMGGKVVSLSPQTLKPLNWRGSVVGKAIMLLDRLR